MVFEDAVNFKWDLMEIHEILLGNRHDLLKMSLMLSRLQ